MRTPHIVPLSRQAIAVLKQIQEISGHLELVFPGAQANSPCFLLGLRTIPERWGGSR
ncbi:hypothetical protein KLQUMA228M_16025 [Klebsiella quasipneumoniae subsp. quasipneumoniae]|jgi:integrase